MAFIHDPDRRSVETGSGRFPFLLMLALTAALVYLMAVFAPVYLGNRQMYDAASEIVHRGAIQNLEEVDIRAQLTEKAREFGLPDDHKIDLWREGKKLTARVTYSQTIRFPFYSYQWPIEIRVEDVGF